MRRFERISLWFFAILLVLVTVLFVGLVKCSAQTVSASEIRMTPQLTNLSALANRYRISITPGGLLACIQPNGTSCLVASGPGDWNTLLNKPTTFTPSPHTHSGADINTGTVSSSYGGTGFTTTPQDTILIGAGTGGLGVGGGWNQVSLCNGPLNYNTTTHVLSCTASGSFDTTANYTLTGLWTHNPSNTTPQAATIYDIVPSYGGLPGNFNSHAIRMCGSAYDGTTTYHPCWHLYGNTTSNAGGSLFTIGYRSQDINSWDDAFQFNRDHSFVILPATADSACTSGLYWLMPNSTTGTWRKCTNGVITDLGSSTGGTTSAAGVTQQYIGFCSGTASSSSTLSIPPFGSANATSCSSTSTTNEVPMEFAGTIKNLRVQAGTAGSNNTSSGVISVYKNGVAQGMGCTIGTSHNCDDLTHTFTVNAGDTIGIRMSTAASETLAGVRVSFEDTGGGFGFNFRGPWAASTVYNPYDVVTYNDGTQTSTYEADHGFTSGTTFNAANWNLWASGATGGSTFTGGTLTSKLTLAASTTSSAGLNFGAGSVAPTTPAAADAWLNGSADFQWYTGTTTKTAERTDRKDAANGYAGLDATGKVPAAEIPAASSSETGQTFYGYCSGTATASATLTIPPFGGAGATSCTSTTTGFEQPILQGGVAQTFKVQVETAGVNASSGVFTVYKNGTATAITCTVGTGTTCNDTTHTVTYAAGDTMGIRFTTQAAETLAKVHVAILVK